ncbi:hypothetical protein QJS04_geneDACA001622 [Acorus gramineus]|uniref:Uncharacterized protein n=1 Tax=Acorus gramineus TaxID=55184 RepID=A0AAV9BDY4_ACOGR|nr:hypothetical protein QJS04_geneDACA001622 [Acorus gramineus]
MEVNAKDTLPEIVWVKVEDHRTEIRIEYEWKPIPCKVCATFGHTVSQYILPKADQERNPGNPSLLWEIRTQGWAVTYDMGAHHTQGYLVDKVTNAQYLKGTSIWNATAKGTASWAWKDMLKLRPTAAKYIGRHINIVYCTDLIEMQR